MKFEVTAKRIRQALSRADMSAKDLSEKTGVQEASISQYVNGYHKPSNISAGKIGKVLGVDPLWLMGFDVPMIKVDDLPSYPNIHPVTTRRFPMLGSVACGEPIMMAEDVEVDVDTTEDIKADFCLRCKGDSMINARIYDGDIVFVKKQPTVENGQIAVVAIDDEATLKRFYRYSDVIVLRAENPSYADIVLTPEEHKRVRVLGRAVWLQGRLV